ncbi:alanine racemase [Luteithermobacter gelatinilyticus]|uniref:alanine racemase n=1 Tax=Luteithermobacter gelatinilyticus TaxID=2582913 RepID=UPI00110728DB|nr:alanine racemase [Luteithermobacter gelatinilyticus]|tara:strand:- start:7628 stop:8764 length:1137 start_codon:yes stop_codon:yes gene_type:complete
MTSDMMIPEATIWELPSDCQASLTIDLPAIVENYQTIRRLANDIEAAAMVKADAYGTGIERVAPALYHHAGCRQFFVANLAEAVKLRRHVPQAVIYVLNGIFPGHETVFRDHDLRPVLNTPEQLAFWRELGGGAPCALHFDTGINRLGFSPEQTERLLNTPEPLNALTIRLVMSHLACADMTDHPLNEKQRHAFHKICEAFPDCPASLANSAGILLGRSYHFDLLRPGLLMFGGNPAIPAPLPEGIRPTCTITGRVLQIRQLEKNMTVGYGATWTAPNSRRIAIVNVGYADGYLQKFNNTGRAFIDGVDVPVVGRVSMDMLALDISDEKLSTVKVGQEVELLGPHITLEKASELSNLSQYEILTGVRERYQRIYIPID